MNIGFWGAGLMGSGLAHTLLTHGHRVAIYSRDYQRACALAMEGPGGQPLRTRRELAREVVISCVARPVYLTEAFLGEEGLYAAMERGSLHLEMSTIDPATAKTLHDAAARRGIDYVQAPLGKTPAEARKATEPIFVGGAPQVKARAWPLLTELGKPVDVGSLEAACAAKLLSNLVGMTNIAVLAEGFRLGAAMGLESHTLLHILEETGARSFQLEARGPMLADDGYDQVKFRLTLALKDLTLGCAMAHERKLPVPLFDQARAAFAAAEGQGLGDLDCAAVGLRGDRTPVPNEP